MDTKNGSVKKRKLRYFYLDGFLYKVIKIDRPKDLVYAWDYAGHRRVMFVWSDAQRRLQNAFKMGEVVKLLNRSRPRLAEYLYDGTFREPQRAYNLNSNRPSFRYWSEDDVLEMYDFLVTVHRGRPRKDGLTTNNSLPTRKELKANMKHHATTYIMDEHGNYIPTWKEKIYK